MPQPTPRLSLNFDLVVRVVVCLAFAVNGSSVVAQTAPDEPPEPARTLGPQPRDAADPIVPPTGPEDSWGYQSTGDHPAEASPGEPGADEASSVEIVHARMKGELGHRWVESIERFEPSAARAAWSAQGDKVAFDAPADLGFRAIYVRDLTTGGRRCLTCDLFQLRKKNVLSPVWHPSGDWIAVTVQDLPRRLLPDPVQMAGMHRALHADLWMLTADGRNAWQLTQSATQGRAVLEAKISHEGDRIAWSERVDSGAGFEGEWVVRVADLDLGKVPSLKAHRTLRPASWPARITVEGFTQDDAGLWLSMTPGDRRGSLAARYDLGTLRLERVDTGGTWDVEARSVPRGHRIVLATDRNLDVPAMLPWLGDLWFTTPLALRQERLTFFNDADSPHGLGEALIADLTWAPDGRSLLLSIVSADSGTPRESLWRVNVSAGLQGADAPPG